MKRGAALGVALALAFLAGAAPTSAASNAWFKWAGTPKIPLTIRVAQTNLLGPFQRAAAAWGASPVFRLTVVQATQCPAIKQISVCSDPQGVHTAGNPGSTQPVLVNGLGVSATIWVYDQWAATAQPAELDYMACHELGHALGLSHQAVPDTCMSYAFARAYPNAQDFRSLGEMYGLPASTDPTVTITSVAPVPVAPSGPTAQICSPAFSDPTGPASDVLNFGDAAFYGSTGGVALTRPIVGMATTPKGTGYWTVAFDGGIFAFGDAKFHGSTGAIRLNQPIVGMARTPAGRGYWLVASDGGIFAFGDAKFHGSTGAIRLNRPVVGMAATPTGRGYWLVASDGGIFAFGDARFHGSTGAIRLNRPVVAMAATPSGAGYWLYASDGGIFNYGDAAFMGSGAGLNIGHSIAGVAASPTGKGYWMAGNTGTVVAFGDARCYGSSSAPLTTSQVQAIVATPSGGGYWLATRR